MTEKKVVCGLIGAGRIGRMHAQNMVSRLGNVFLKAVCDPMLDEGWAEATGIPVRCADTGEILGDPEIEAVVIAAPSSAHVDLIGAASRARKHIFCEKPIAFTADQVGRAVESARSAGVRLQVGFNRRFDADFRQVREAVRTGAVGTPQIIRITNRDPVRPRLEFVRQSGGIFMDFGIHDFDTLRYVSGAEVEEIYATGDALIDPEIRTAGDIDTALITIRLRGGALCVIDLSRETHYGYDQRLEVFGSKGSVVAGNRTATRTVLSTEAGVLRDKPLFSFVERYREAFVTELEEFFAGIRDGGDLPVSGEDAMEAVRIAEAAAESFQTNKTVRVAR